jgi:hypothetical protein
MARSKTDRSRQVAIRLEPKIYDGLQELSDRFGIAPTTLAGLAIGEYVSKNLATLSNQSRAIDAMSAEMARVIGGPFAAMFEGKSLDEMKHLFADDEKPEKQVDWTEAHHD